MRNTRRLRNVLLLCACALFVLALVNFFWLHLVGWTFPVDLLAFTSFVTVTLLDAAAKRAKVSTAR